MQPIGDSTKPVLLLCPPSPPHLGQVDLLMNLLFNFFPAVKGLLAAELDMLWKGYHGG